MGFLDALFGRAKPVKSHTEQIFAIGTARITLEMNVGMRPGSAAGVVYRPLESGAFTEAEREIDGILQLSAKDTGSRISRRHDEFGMEWIVVEDDDFDDLVATIHMVSLTLTDKGYKDQLLAAAFRFEAEGRPVYWLYNFKRGTFYPFVPAGPQRRDNRAELRYAAVMEKQLPIEKATEQWYPLWGMPF